MEDRTPLAELRRYGRALIAEEQNRYRPVAIGAVDGPPAALRRMVAFAAAAALVVGTATIATASDSAVPGDALYGVDRAVERVTSLFGMGDAERDERVAEANVLLARGDIVGALELAEETALSQADSAIRMTIEAAIQQAIDVTSKRTNDRRYDLHVAVGDLIFAARAGAIDPGVPDVVDAAHRVADIAGGAAADEDQGIGRNGDSPHESPQSTGGSPRSDEAGSSAGRTAGTGDAYA